MLLRYANINCPFRKMLFKFTQSCSGFHCCSDCNYFFIFLCNPYQSICKGIGPAYVGCCNIFLAVDRVKFGHAMKLFHVFFRELVTLSFFSLDMEQNRAFQVFYVLKSHYQLVYVMAVDWAEVLKSEALKENSFGCQISEPLLRF